MECAEGVGKDDGVDDVIDVNEYDEQYDLEGDAATGAGLEELDVEQCVGESNIEINRRSGSWFIIGDDGTQREQVRDTWNGDGLVTPTVGNVYNSWEEVERTFKEYRKKKGFGVIRGQSAYYGGTKNKHAMTMRCECYGCPHTKIKNDEKRQKDMEIGGCSGEELIQRRRWKKVTLEHSGYNPEPGQAMLVKQNRMEHFTTSMRSRVFNDIDAGVPLANIHGSILYEKRVDTRWEEVTIDYGIVNDEWLCGLFVGRSMWVPPYLKDQFWAGMRTTQRVESINSFFDKFVTRQTRLYEFGEKYVEAVERRIMQEKEADEKVMEYTQNLLTRIPLEKYFQRIYTNAKFREFQRECERLMYCYVKEEIPNGDHMYSYVIEDRVRKIRKGGIHEYLTPKRRMYHSAHKIEEKEIECTCRMFETHGLLCRHAIRVLDMNLFEEPPEKYVLRRWQKDIRRKHTLVQVCYHNPSKTENTKRFDKMNAVSNVLTLNHVYVNEHVTWC
ncbi:Protein FAR-RED IMPAIRED RESPONSE 1 [Bienertia sinuspersici]